MNSIENASDVSLKSPAFSALTCSEGPFLARRLSPGLSAAAKIRVIGSLASGAGQKWARCSRRDQLRVRCLVRFSNRNSRSETSKLLTHAVKAHLRARQFNEGILALNVIACRVPFILWKCDPVLRLMRCFGALSN